MLPERKRQNKSQNTGLALQALLLGAGAERIPAEAAAELSHKFGNSALLELLSHRAKGPELFSYRAPAAELNTRPLEWSDRGPALTSGLSGSESGDANAWDK